MKMVNIGCGSSYHQDWINLDLFSAKQVKHHNIKKALPFNDNAVDVIYHSHVLEHLNKADAEKFIKDCYRTLKPGGIMRVVVPNLETICLEYLKNLNLAFNNEGDEISLLNYRWNKIEMLDQLVRREPGGEMAKITFNNPKNKEYIIQRNGNDFFPKDLSNNKLKKLTYLLSRFKIRELLLYIQAYLSSDKTKKTGEKHYWNYDKLDLKILLTSVGFKNYKIQNYNESGIPDWNQYGLDQDENNLPRKPDSIFVEVIK